MKIVGSYLGFHDTGVALIEGGKIKAAYHEERFRRKKSVYLGSQFPLMGLEALQKDFGFKLFDKDVQFATAKPVFHISDQTKELLNNGLTIHTYDHQYCHACNAYYTSGFPNERTLVFTYDGGDGGSDAFTHLDKDNQHRYLQFKYDSSFSSAWIVKNDRLIEIDKRFVGGSIANIWYGACTMYGFQWLKDEGKIMGLAPQGKFNQEIYDQLQFFVEQNAIQAFCSYGDHIMDDVPEKEKEQFKKDFAFTLQMFTEEWLLKHISYLYETHGPFDNLALSGGIFANVKLNQRINEYLKFKNIWVCPAMGDDGLSVGSAIAHALKVDTFTNRPLTNVFLGKKYSSSHIHTEFDNFEEKYNRPLHYERLDVKKAASLLQQGKVIGVYDGEAEWGPRALGHRSILVEPTRAETHRVINERLNRNDIMPFAPIIMEEHVQNILYYFKSKHTSEFMTLCYTVRPNWVDKIPAVIQRDDNTCRPQVVNRDRQPLFHYILSEFNALTDIPVLMNTSFNVHGEPIINDIDHALLHLTNNVVDYLIVGAGDGDGRYWLCHV